MSKLQKVDCDALVIGGGITGCFIALRLAQKGMKVCLADKGPLFREASGRSGGGVRQQFRNKAELPLAMESVRLWHDIARELGECIEYWQGGSLRLHRTKQLHEEDKIRVERERAQGLAVQLLTAQQVRARVPVLSAHIKLFGGTYCPLDGTANPLLMGRALTHALLRADVGVYSHEEIRTLETGGGRLSGAVGSMHFFRCPIAVNAAGPWASKIMQTIGFDFPVTFRKSQILVTEPLSPVIQEFISFDKGYLRQAKDGNFHLGVRGIPIVELETSQTMSSFEDVGRDFPEVFPFLANVQIIRAFAGITTWTADGIPILDEVPGVAGLWVASGFSGHGFCLGPVVGKLFSEWITTGCPSLDMSAFAWSRFGNVKRSSKLEQAVGVA
ncbi:MAG: FAD-binding oxidoreductase [Deltaproteobacteria bacterium]|nr:FAD-binding oxidoreductase [Deltaproteobacteria bacterium]